ncbi:MULTISPECIES: mechanosensitive ion channel family protein [Pseudomonas]|uniref:mechanosensitive ion channel family protein n=1 Tax=Pseudomonas TaxID=286 RepID=UPI001C7F87A6|nr:MULTISPECIES: mechanosensitive ion channel family protein [Pseudomonas]MDG9929922.1 mechanosensitive ion channel family protein [Pseudomonas sp. GD04042]MDH0485027.1 mechanosensitive ion channel family protein [Pseudomonas sp. GD04015]MDH0606409.1 mechanosensitive ion channel family protein [Pseudomonas sp. GD03869]MDH0896781.1 mechanosensitive ion channel family protein [Pseudomonas sp. GD03875]MDH1066566.1 mechanosensitive ion channel family protein [Pseudomonas sp. GD03985]
MDLTDINMNQLVTASEAWFPVVIAYGSRLLLAFVTLLIGWWLINRLTARVGALIAMRHTDKALQGFIENLANIVLKVLLVISVASMVGIETTSFIAAIGAAGLAIGLALQGSLANFAGGVLILLFRPFRIGDWIEAQGVSGTVDSIQIFHTVLRTGDNRTVIVPNGALSNGTITNTSRQATRQVVFDVKVDYDSDLQKAQQVLREMAEDPRVLKNPAPAVVVAGLGETAITLSLRVWTANSDYWPVTFRFNEEIRDRLRQVGVDIATPGLLARGLKVPEPS